MGKRRLRGAAGGVVLMLGSLACGGEVETHPRTLASGRQIDVFRIFTTQGRSGVLLDYFYLSNFNDKAAFDIEWAEVVQDAQQEADKRDAVEVMLIGTRRGAGFLSRLFTGSERAAYFTKQNGRWTEDKPR